MHFAPKGKLKPKSEDKDILDILDIDMVQNSSNQGRTISTEKKLQFSLKMQEGGAMKTLIWDFITRIQNLV